MLVTRLVKHVAALPDCQHFDLVGKHNALHCAWFYARTNYGIRTNIQRRSSIPPLGKASRFSEGEWVQVRSASSIKATLDTGSRLRGLVFLPYQWPYCDGIFRVHRVMRRIVDDRGVWRAVSGTVLLEGVDCGGASGNAGCGRKCPLMFRDEWLQPASAPRQEAREDAAIYARVRSTEEILLGLDGNGKRDGLTFLPQMYRCAGGRFKVAKVINSVIECERTVPTQRPTYILDGLHCAGAILGQQARCDRACSILWHPDWLTLEDGAA
jgi:hypothetical protein